MRLEPPRGNRAEVARWLAGVMVGCFLEEEGEARPAEMRGGRTAGVERLALFSVVGYATRRNFVSGDLTVVSKLSPYLRHGMVGLKEVAEHVKREVGRTADAVKFWAELGWRVFWRGVYERMGDRIYEEMEPPKVSLGKEAMPPEVVRGETGLVCMDETVKELVTTGYVHNHARMWFASYVVHHRKVSWREGERFFYRHLLDGDPASNALSWQWVASTFSVRPYVFNRENVERFTGGCWCARCRARCPFDAGYEELERRLFGGGNR